MENTHEVLTDIAPINGGLKARIKFNKEYHKMKGKSELLRVAEAFNKYWIFFAILSTLATFYSFNKIGNNATVHQDGLTVTFILVVSFGLAVAFESAKHASIKWVFTKQHIITKVLSFIVAPTILIASIFFHFLGGESFVGNKNEIVIDDQLQYVKDLNAKSLEMKQTLINSIAESSRAVNNGKGYDDINARETAKSAENVLASGVYADNKAVMSLVKMKIEASGENAELNKFGIVSILVAMELLLLSSALSKVIIAWNSDTNEEFEDIKDKIDTAIAQQGEQFLLSYAQQSLEALRMNAMYYTNVAASQSNKMKTDMQKGTNNVAPQPQYQQIGVQPSVNKGAEVDLTKEDKEEQENLRLWLKEIIEIVDIQDGKWLYFRGFISPRKAIDGNIVLRLSKPPMSGFTSKNLQELFISQEFEFPYALRKRNDIKAFCKKCVAIIEEEKATTATYETEFVSEEEEENLDNEKTSLKNSGVINLSGYDALQTVALISMLRSPDIELGERLPGQKSILKKIKIAISNNDIRLAGMKVGESIQVYTMDMLREFYISLEVDEVIEKITNSKNPVAYYILKKEFPSS